MSGHPWINRQDTFTAVNRAVESRQWLVAKIREFLPAGSLRARFTLGVFWSTMGAVISRGFTLASLIVCARLLGKEGFGELGMIQSTVGAFGIFAGLGLGLTATKYVAEFRNRDNIKVGRILALSAIAAFFSGSIMTVVLAAMAPSLSRKMLAAPHLAVPLVAASGLVFCGALNGAQTGALAGFEAFRTIARVNIWTGLSSFPLVALGVWRWGITGAVLGLVAAMVVNWVLNNRALGKECIRSGISYDFRFFYREWRVLHNFSLPALLASIILAPALWACNLFLVHQPNGYSQLGLYAAADRWRLLILFVPTSVFGMVVPILSSLYGSGDESGFQRVIRANLFLNICLALLPALIVAVTAEPIMSLYGVQFRAGWPILMVLAFAATPEAMNNIYMARLICAQQMWWRVVLDLQLVTVLLLLAWWWIPRWGAMGLAMAYVAAMLTLAALQIVLARHPLLNQKTVIQVA